MKRASSSETVLETVKPDYSDGKRGEVTLSMMQESHLLLRH